MNIVITMAGLGLRFREAGYTVPKYQIEVRGKTLFEWSMSSLKNFFDEPFIFLVRKEDDATNFIDASCKKLGIDGKIFELEKLTRGQAETALFAEKFWKADEPLMIYNIDTYVEPGQLKAELIRGAGFIPCFTAGGNHWSFVKLDESGKAVGIIFRDRRTLCRALRKFLRQRFRARRTIHRSDLQSAHRTRRGGLHSRYPRPIRSRFGHARRSQKFCGGGLKNV